MCIIVAKPENKPFPTYDTLLECWKRNKDGAGYMFPYNDSVVIRKGFMKFGDFINSLIQDVKIVGNDVPFVMHFRITTQGGVKPELTHPFPLSRNMDDLKILNSSAEIGIAHNGIISLTKEYGTVDYSDTMKFITEYVSRLVKYNDWYTDEDTKTLIKNLCGSKLCFLDKYGHLEFVGDGFVTDEETGIIYSNTSYKENRYTTTVYNYPTTTPSKEKEEETSTSSQKKEMTMSDWEEIRKKFSCCKGENGLYEQDGKYRFIPGYFCPKLTDKCSGYCGNCMFADYCKKNGGK